MQPTQKLGNMAAVALPGRSGDVTIDQPIMAFKAPRPQQDRHHASPGKSHKRGGFPSRIIGKQRIVMLTLIELYHPVATAPDPVRAPPLQRQGRRDI